MRAALCFVDDQPAGFVAYTAHSYTFHSTAIKKHLWYVIYLALLSFVHNPLIFFRLLKAVRLMISRRSEKKDLSYPVAEILAIGVSPEFLSPQFISKTGLRISHELFKHAVKYFKGLGLKKLRLAVDDFNKQALLFYHGLGGRIGEAHPRAGDRLFQIWFDLDLLSI
jgi:ribosomal protein S18 acetylase RimI-like enzyme